MTRADAVRRLRAAAALAHVVPQVALELVVDRGPRVVVSRCPVVGPDLDPCELRRLLAAADARAVGAGWIEAVDEVVVGGSGVRTAAGVLVVDGPEATLTAFVTDLDAAAVQRSVAELAAELVAEDPSAAPALAEVTLRVHRDEALAQSVVVVPWPRTGDGDDDVDVAVAVTARLAARCRVDALLAEVGAHLP